MFLQFLKRNAWILIIIMGGGIYFAFFRPVPCSTPITYHIGEFDTRFGISKEDFLSSMSKAEVIWETPVKKNLFAYDPNGDLVVNLIYDNRQQTTQKTQVLKTDLSKTNALAQSLQTRYKSLEDDYVSLEAEYKSSLAQLQVHQDAYNTEVEYWNSRGGAPKQEYAKLTTLKNNLVAEQTALENKRQQINNLADQINTFINKYNLLVKDANTNIDKINSTAGKEFEEGLYDPNTNEINIYEFSDSTKLKRVLAHELGHALGLDHNDNERSIMYALNVSTSEKLSPEELTALKAKCSIQ